VLVLFSLFSSAESETRTKASRPAGEKEFSQKNKSETDVFTVTDSMPPQQRYPPSAWDRGGLLGPRGNARFLEVDGLRVKYIGRFFGKEKESVAVGASKTSPRWQMFFFFSSPSPRFAKRRCCAFVCLGLLSCDVLKKRNDLLLSAT